MNEELLKSKLESFKLNFSNTKIFEQNLEKLFSYIFSNIFQNILNLPRIDFINSLTTTVKAVLEEHYTKEIYSNQRFVTLFINMNKKFEKKYNEYNQLLSLSYENYQNELFNQNGFKEDMINLSKYNLTTFRKHCRKTQEYAIHNCNKKEKGKYLIVIDKTNKNEIKFIICENCRKSYYAGLFINYCEGCKCDYYCGLVSPKEDKKLFPATYNPPHCETIANDKINCTKCKSVFYYNLEDDTLQCMNKACKYKISPNLANFKCNICLSYFKSDVKIFNNFELLYIKRIISIALLIKEKAHPGILPCCKNLDLKELLFYHKKECKGALYFWILNKKLIVICEKCKAINYFNRFIWTCPNCLLHFKDKKEEIEEKLKKNLFNNLKLNLNLKILLGDEYIPNISFENCNSTSKLNIQVNPCCKIFHKLRRKRSLREVLDMKKLESAKIKEDDKNKEAEKDIKIGKYILKKKIYESYNNDNNMYKSNSKLKLEDSEIKSSLKKKRNYLFEKLIRKQFLPKKNVSAIDNNNKKGKFEAFSEQKNNKNKEKEIENQNGLIITEKNLLKYREKSEYNFNFLKRDERNNYNTDRNGNIISQKMDNNKNDKLNNSDDNDQIDKTSIIIEYNQKIKKRNRIKSNLPPLPLKIPKSGRIQNNFNYDVDRKDIISEREKEREIEIDKNDDLNLDSKEKKELIYSDKKEKEKDNIIDDGDLSENNQKIENIEKNTNNFNFIYKLSNQNGYHTPKLTMKNDLDRSFRKKFNKKNPNYNRKCTSTIRKEIINLKYNLNLINLKEEKNENIVQKLEDKFNETYTQKKTKNITNSQDEEDKNDDKEKEEEKHDEEENAKKEEFMNKKKKIVKNNIFYYFKKISSKKKKNSLKSKFNVYNKINPINNDLNNSNGKKEREQDKEKEQEQEQNQEQEDELPTLNINEEKQKYNIEKEKKDMKDKDPYQPDDIITSSLYYLKGDIPIENPKIKNDEHLYNSIQRKMKCILSKGKLPLFNINNYEIEKQIGEGSFGLIFRVVNIKTNIKYAMKKIIANNLTALESYQKEFEIVHQNSHKYILDILGICLRCLDQTTYVLYVLMDLALYDWDYEIEQRKKSRRFYKEEELISILRQISSALVFLQREKKIAHRDIKPENILVFKNGIYKLGDFGEAKVNRYMRNNARSTIRGTEMYMSPILFKSLQENMDDVQHDIYKSDVFSLGYCFVYAAALDFKIIYEIRNLNSDFKVKKILQRIFFLKYSNDFIELLLKMICNKEEDRVDFIGLEKLLEKEHFK